MIWQHAIRQKSRWIVGIVFQGTKTWAGAATGLLNYFLWRDRRGLFAYLLSFMVNLLFVVLLAMWLVTVIAPSPGAIPRSLPTAPCSKHCSGSMA